MVRAAGLKSRNKDLIYDFLAGLGDVFDKVRSDILQIKPLPELAKCFNFVHREAQRQATMLKAMWMILPWLWLQNSIFWNVSVRPFLRKC
ncbi:hypothetical protein FF2_002687 [Malus domestica]